jgi:hypothetical protein
MREVFGHWVFRLPFLRRFTAMTLAPWCIVYRDAREKVDGCTRRHEAEHLAQYRRVGFLRFYGTYLGDWLRGLWRTRSLEESYRAIRWEVMAYAVGEDAAWPPECCDLPVEKVATPGAGRASRLSGQRENRTPTGYPTGS